MLDHTFFFFFFFTPSEKFAPSLLQIKNFLFLDPP